MVDSMALSVFSRALALGIVTLGFAASAQAAGDAVAGKIKTYACQGCHGIPGTKTAFPELYSVPKLGGQHPQYIVSALKAYKTGQRNHSTMQANASTLSDQDMEDIAAYYGAK
jgi:cytochrome c553